MKHALFSRSPRPGFVECDDPVCVLTLGPHYREAAPVRAEAPPDPIDELLVPTLVSVRPSSAV